MLDFYAHFSPWLAACLGVGAATGALVSRAPTRKGIERKGPARWLLWSVLAFLAGGAAVALGAVEGAAAVYVASALACFAAFVVGAALLALAFRKSLSAHEGWAVGLVPVALIWGSAVYSRPPAPPAEQPQASVAESAAPAPVQKEQGSDETATIPPPPATWENPASDPQSVLAALPAGDLDAAACQRALDAIAALDPVAFRSSRSTVNRRAALALDKAAEIIRRCPAATIEVHGYGDEGVEEDTLSRRRALAAERYLRREGVGGRPLVAVGCCESAKAERRPSAIDYVVR